MLIRLPWLRSWYYFLSGQYRAPLRGGISGLIFSSITHHGNSKRHKRRQPRLPDFTGVWLISPGSACVSVVPLSEKVCLLVINQ